MLPASSGDRARLWVRRLEGGRSVEQPIAGDEPRALRRYLATRTDALPWLFVSEREQPLTRQAVNYLVAAAAARANLTGVHPHTLRHSCGFALADKEHDLRLIQDHLGHRAPGTPSTPPAPRAPLRRSLAVGRRQPRARRLIRRTVRRAGQAASVRPCCR